jgi:hypothetical protein
MQDSSIPAAALALYPGIIGGFFLEIVSAKVASDFHQLFLVI